MKDFKEISRKQWFTSDLHFGDPRLNLYSRELVADSSDKIDELIIENFNKMVGEKDTVYFLGDIAYTPEKIALIDRLNGTKILIKGNYDDKISDEILLKYFESVQDELIVIIDTEKIFLTHYPTKCIGEMFNICGHIHGTWKVQRNSINVGVDAWHLCPVSEDNIKFQINGIQNHYDANVFAGELESNLKHKK
jgi:calcineurin-like phosphoesterase family protein